LPTVDGGSTSLIVGKKQKCMNGANKVTITKSYQAGFYTKGISTPNVSYKT